MRRMYLASDLHALPDNPEIVAYTVAGYDGQLSDFPDAMHVPVDTNGRNAEQAVVLDCVGDRFTVNQILRWVNFWQNSHLDGFSSGNGTFFKPVILIEEDMVKVMQKVLDQDACDWWAYPQEKYNGPFGLTFATVIAPAQDDGPRYSVSAVWDDMWGKTPEPLKPKAEKIPVPVSKLQGLVLWSVDGLLHGHAVVSIDLGESWRTPPSPS